MGPLTLAATEALAVKEANRVLVEKIRERFDVCDKGVHARARTKWEHLWALYRNYTDFRDGRDKRDRDTGLREAKREFGAELFIPYSFSTVESVLPRMLSNSPTVIVKPLRQQWEANAPNMRTIINGQYAAINYELVLQEVARLGLIYGMGVQKTYWATKTAQRNRLRAATGNASRWVVEPSKATVIDDPMIEAVDPFDWFWDPFAGNVQDCEWVIHRTWRSMDYVHRQMKAGVWDQSAASREDVEMGPGGSAKYDETWGKRARINGYGDTQAAGIHEVWEYHDRERVITVLDREWVVQVGDNPAWHGELPFQVFRPTPIHGRMVGIGEIEPIEDLQEEMNTLRSQRRDNATMALQRSFFYMQGMIDPADFKVGPGLGIPVLGDPREIVSPIPISDIPNSGYQEESTLKADIERATGLDDTAAGGSSKTTATGTQLTQAMANLRIQQKTRVAEVELVRGSGRQVMSLNQQKILGVREVREPMAPEPGQPDKRWAWKQVGPAELAGEFELEVEGGSMAPENVPQQRQDAQAMLQLAGQNPMVNQREALGFALINMGVKTPETFIVPEKPEAPTIDPQVVGPMLEAAGVDPGLIQQTFASAAKPPEES